MMHDLEFESARRFRCEWYEEHNLWGNQYDQLSLAHVMARREVERRIVCKEPDDHLRRTSRLKEDPDIDMFTDKNSWYLISNQDQILSHPVIDVSLSNRNDPPDIMDMEDTTYVERGSDTIEEEGIYVRIMGELWAKFFRRQWKENREKG
jgi:hypothetical protein